jgi:glutathione peroxidase
MIKFVENKNMRYFSFLCLLLFGLTSLNDSAKTIYHFEVNDIMGNPFRFETLRGKKVMLVNTASKCGLTPQYAELEALYQQFKDSNFIIIGFPSNDFLHQEPGTDSEIASFCQKNYGVSFPMMSKVVVKGDSICPLYKYLTSRNENGYSDNTVKWNFQKYLINESGFLEHVIPPSTKPMDQEIVDWIRK